MVLWLHTVFQIIKRKKENFNFIPQNLSSNIIKQILDDAEFSSYSFAVYNHKINHAFTDASKENDIVCQYFVEPRITLNGFYENVTL